MLVKARAATVVVSENSATVIPDERRRRGQRSRERAAQPSEPHFAGHR